MELNLEPIQEHSYTWIEGFYIKPPTYKDGMRQLDWDTIHKIIESNEFERIEVGLAEDWEQTHAVIFEDNEVIIKENCGAGFYGGSRWATPSVKLTKNGETELFECWVLGSKTDFPDWLINKAKREDYWDFEINDL